MAVTTRAGSRKQARNVRKYKKRSKRRNLRQPVSIKGSPTKRHISHTHFTRYAKNQRLERRIISRIFLGLNLVDGDKQFERRKRLVQTKPGQTIAQIAQGIFPPYLARVFSRTRTKRQREYVPRKVNLGGSAMHMIGQAEPILNEEATRFLHALGIRTLPPGCDWDQVECLKYLEWEISLRWAVDSLELGNQNDFIPSTIEAVHDLECHPHQFLLAHFPFAESQPTYFHFENRGEDLKKERERMRDRMLHGSFQIPSDWTPIRDIYPPESMCIREGTLNSAVSDVESLRLGMEGIYNMQRELGTLGRRRSITLSPPLTITSRNVSPVSPSPQISGGSSRNQPSVPEPRRTTSHHIDHTMEEDPAERRMDGDWQHTGITRGSTVNGDEIDDASIPDAAADEANSPPSPPPYQRPAIKFIPKLHEYLPTLVHDWEMLVATKHYSFIWRYQDPEAMRSRTMSRHVRVFSTSRPPLNPDINLPGATARMIASHGGDMSSSQEAGNRHILGRFLADMIATEAIPAHCSFRKEMLPGWQCPSTPVLLDVACFPSREELPWNERAIPLLLAAQFSEDLGGHDRMAAEPLACAFHSTLIVLILYYLDTRLREEDKLPSWMVVYGIIYTKTGFSIHEHYPVYHAATRFRPARWGGSSTLAVHFEDIFDPQSPPQSQPISALLRICGHAQFILATLKAWNGYQRIVASHFIPGNTMLPAKPYQANNDGATCQDVTTPQERHTLT